MQPSHVNLNGMGINPLDRWEVTANGVSFPMESGGVNADLLGRVCGSCMGQHASDDLNCSSSQQSIENPQVLLSNPTGLEDSGHAESVKVGCEVQKVDSAAVWRALQNIGVVGIQDDEWYEAEINRMEKQDKADKEGRDGGNNGKV
ncbi:hypothetical protein VNO78_33206 [Psophocarpus tetragonolobus]|uniref:Uncharacterized protein n=1 Tax=Psophocarpus tetragonolobus TaxID=3891 RepID=A0AAN9RPJ0_PSOTE